MNTFLEFIHNKNKSKKIYESFKSSDFDKVNELIYKIVSKHISHTVIPIVGYEDLTDKDTKLMSKAFIVYYSNNKKCKLFTINWNKSKSSMTAYSIDFYDNLDLLFNGSAKTTLSLYTMGSSIVYFLPIIWTLAESGDFNITEDEAIKLGRQSLKHKNESYEYKVGEMSYNIYENLSRKIINDAFDAANESMRSKSDEVNAYLDNKYNQATQSEKTKGKDDPQTQELWNQFEEVLDAIRQGNADTIDDLRIAIKHNVKIVQELDSKSQKQEEEFNKKREDPEVVFKKMTHYINLVLKGVNNSVILCGAPGVGKTFRVKRALKQNGYVEGENLYTIKGKCSPPMLYARLYSYRHKGEVIVIDDADALVGPNAPEDVINILKSALDTTSDDEGRLVAYSTKAKIYDEDGNEVPSRMYFNGACIIITNWNAGALDTALRGRSFVQDINFTVEDILLMVKRLMPDMLNDVVSMENKQRAYDYLEQLAKEGANMEISFRTFGLCAKLFESIPSDESIEIIQDMIREQMEMQALRGKNKY